MIKLAILITRKHRLLSVAAILDIFESVNNIQHVKGLPPSFDIRLYGSGFTHSYENYVMHSVQDSGTLDLILIPAFGSENIQHALTENQIFINWLQEQYKLGAKLGSFCTGAFLLGASGLLNGKRATTHMDSVTVFASCFPKVLLESDAVVTDDHGIFTSGGATSSFHLMLYLIRDYCGNEMALGIAKMFAIDIDRHQQTYFGTFSPSQKHGDELVNRAQQKIEQAYQEGTTIEELIQDIPASRRNVVRRFKQATGVTPIEYLQRTRIEAAKKLLELTSQSVMEVMLNSGYNDLKSFRQLFKKNAGVTPKEYRDKFNIARMLLKRNDKLNTARNMRIVA